MVNGRQESPPVVPLNFDATNRQCSALRERPALAGKTNTNRQTVMKVGYLRNMLSHSLGAVALSVPWCGRRVWNFD